MVQRGEQARFALETLEPFGVAGENVGQELKGDFAAKSGVDRVINGAHAAFAYLRRNTIVRDCRAGIHLRLAGMVSPSPTKNT
jgi:hypothetical protein